MKVWNSETRQSDEIAIPGMSDEMLVSEYGAECEGESRRISSDPPSHENELREEIDKRLATAARLTALLEDREGLETELFHALARYDKVTEGDLSAIATVVADRLIAYLKPLG